MRIAAFTKYGRRAASTRQRLLQFGPALEAAGFEIDFHPLLDDDYVASIGTGRGYSKARIAAAYARRMGELLRRPKADVLWLYAELFPYLPAFFERLARWPRRPIVYDCDDAFFHQYDDHPNGAVRRLLGGKLEPLLRSASACTCGNAYLRDYARRFCPNSIVVPTVVDTDVYRPAPRSAAAVPVIGWIGSPSTWPYVRPLLPLLRELARAGSARVRIVGAGPAARTELGEGMELAEWSEKAEVAEVQAMDIGIMPLPDSKWARGKSGFKLVQYMAVGLPVVASPVGVNSDIVADGTSGHLARDEAQWREALERLLADAGLRARMGAAGRERAVAGYSLASQAPRIVALFRDIAGGTER